MTTRGNALPSRLGGRLLRRGEPSSSGAHPTTPHAKAPARRGMELSRPGRPSHRREDSRSAVTDGRHFAPAACHGAPGDHHGSPDGQPPDTIDRLGAPIPPPRWPTATSACPLGPSSLQMAFTVEPHCPTRPSAAFAHEPGPSREVASPFTATRSASTSPARDSGRSHLPQLRRLSASHRHDRRFDAEPSSVDECTWSLGSSRRTRMAGTWGFQRFPSHARAFRESRARCPRPDGRVALYCCPLVQRQDMRLWTAEWWFESTGGNDRSPCQLIDPL